MHLLWPSFLALVLSQKSALAKTPSPQYHASHNYYVIEHDPNISARASMADLTRALGVELVEQVGELENVWLVRREKPVEELANRGESTDHVVAELERLRRRAAVQKRSYFWSRSDSSRQLVDSIKFFDPQTLRARTKRIPQGTTGGTGPVVGPLVSAAAQKFDIQDPLFPLQWHIVNEEFPEHSMNVTPLWDAGFTGKGMTVSIVDDGLDYTSDDLAANFDPTNSYDFNARTDLPFPAGASDTHGTRCAGQIGAGRNNNACGVGIAYDAKIAGVRILGGQVSDADEAAALNLGFQTVSVYSNSWGPTDDGKTMEAPSYLTQKAFVNGITKGRDGKGSIIVFASGNGAEDGDQCNFDGFTNSIYTVTIGAIDYKGLAAPYSERCSANMVVGYSSGSGRFITTTDKGKNKCSSNHSGTSAATPNAAAVFALALQARPELTWRDIQHLCVHTARMVQSTDPDWGVTAAGRPYSYVFGYGALDGSAFVRAAQDWQLVKPQTWLETPTVQVNNGQMTSPTRFSGGQPLTRAGFNSTLTITKEMVTSANLDKVEHITIQVWITHTKRGDVTVGLVSPNGILSILAVPRPLDSAKTGYFGWKFMTVKHWDENPVGDWKLSVADRGTAGSNGTFLGWNMVVWGSAADASKARAFDLENVDPILPPPNKPSTSNGNTNTKNSAPRISNTTNCWVLLLAIALINAL
ncbi:peptidase S8/S53 domain-containing protein [Infundibulicybe gibba]|nr:peptidase S8/S53 domain-containing protein [Infundibulicybe gibba]